MRFRRNEPLGVWWFGINLIRIARFPSKIGLFIAILMVPSLLSGVLWFKRVYAQEHMLRVQMESARLIKPLLQLNVLVQKMHIQAGFSLVEPALGVELQSTRSQITSASADLSSALKSHDGAGLSAAWQALQTSLQRMPSADADAYLNTMRDVHGFKNALDSRAELTQGIDPLYALLMASAVDRLLPISESLGWAGYVGTGSMAMHADSLSLRLHEWQSTSADAQTVAAIQAYLALLKQDLSTPADFKIDSNGYLPASVAALDAVFTSQTRLLVQAEQVLQQRLDALEMEFNAVLITLLSTALVLFYLVVSFYKGLMIDLRRIKYCITELTRGNMRVISSVRSEDEIGEIALAIRDMITSVSSMVTAVGSDAALVAHVGQNLSHGNRDLTERTEQQMANLEQTSARVHELASTVEQNARSAGDVDRQTASVRDIAESGAHSMHASIASVEAIQQSAHRMNEIIGVIDGLAFQTNILALNAAVEAARAGESGRGFSVVASEVRSLAQRSAESAREIRNLIKMSSTQVESSVEKIKTAGEGMTQILAGIRAVSSSISLISVASGEQNKGIKEISAAVMQLEEITHLNAKLVDMAQSQSNSLEQRADSLNASISQFKLGQGVAQEAIVLVQRAVELRHQHASPEAFRRAVTDKANALHDRDMSVFVFDTSGTYLAFAAPDKVGKCLQNEPGLDGDDLLQKMIDQAATEPGWVEYEVMHAKSGKVRSMMAYVQALDDTCIACSVLKTI